jgi:hypothetical protein
VVIELPDLNLPSSFASAYFGAAAQHKHLNKGFIMLMIMIVTVPHHKFNAAVKDGTAGAKLGKILDAIKPESVHFTEICGKRTAFIVVDLPDVARIPALAEPWFLTFEADVQIHPCMTPDDLKRGGLDALGKQWS